MASKKPRTMSNADRVTQFTIRRMTGKPEDPSAKIPSTHDLFCKATIYMAPISRLLPSYTMKKKMEDKRSPFHSMQKASRSVRLALTECGFLIV
jgi:hypothetical protein